MGGVLALEVVVEDTVEVLDTVTKAEEALEDMTTTMMEETLEVRFHLSEDKYLTGVGGAGFKRRGLSDVIQTGNRFRGGASFC